MENWAVSEADPSKGWNMTMNRTSRPVMTCFDLSRCVFGLSGFVRRGAPVVQNDYVLIM